ncbi:ribonuclease H-like domain-containing protein [Tanacetum coccineum]|uniref:Ribonuclease H-like domain-containing protein n=1 Tax=Tanacetum coccineum TaxID=301880 RepID=A0ABQ4ZM78_9ASTR
MRTGAVSSASVSRWRARGLPIVTVGGRGARASPSGAQWLHSPKQGLVECSCRVNELLATCGGRSAQGIGALDTDKISSGQRVRTVRVVYIPVLGVETWILHRVDLQEYPTEDCLRDSSHVSDDEEDNVSQPKIEKKIVRPNIVKKEFVKSKQQEKSAWKTIKQVKQHRQNTHSLRGNQRNWNNMMSQKLGSNFEMFNKACYVCGSFDHLQVDCNYHQKQFQNQMMVKPVWNNAQRVNYQNFAKKTHPCATKNMVPRAVLMKYGLVSVNTARQIDGGYVAFGGNPKGWKITGKGTIKLLIDESQVLLRVPRKNNMYSVDLKNIVPKGGLTCLFAKATSDESKLWHRRLGKAAQSLFLKKKMYCLVVTDDYSRFTWVFFLATKDETSGILKSFITGIENLVDHKVKVIRCNNGTEFKNREMNQFCEMKEAVNTACYVQNRVLVVKAHNKTPYKLFHGRRSTLSFMRSFGCPVTILNTIDHLGKFDGKADEDTKSSHDDGSKPSSDDGKKVDEDPRKDSECKDQEKEDNAAVNVAGTNEVNAVGEKTSIELPFDPNMPALEDDSIFDFSRDDEDDSVVADMNNLDTTIQVSPNPITRIHKDHPIDQVIEDLQSATQTRKMSKNLEEHGYQVNPNVSHLHAVKRIFRYLKGQLKLGLWYPKDSPFDLVAYTNSDYAGSSLDRKSTIGGCQFLGCRLISWQCKKQTVVANSTTEAEYVAASSCCGQVKTINGEAQLHTLVDGKKIIITESSVRKDLKLEDA